MFNTTTKKGGIEITLDQAKKLLAMFQERGKRPEVQPVVDENREVIGWNFPTEDGSVIFAPPTTFPWVAHERNTWLHRYMTTKAPVTLRKWQGHGKDDVVVELPIGSRVKIVMASRFGDIGITDELTVEHGYHARIPLDELDAKFENFSMNP
jgi:hypothetical protein